MKAQSVNQRNELLQDIPSGGPTAKVYGRGHQVCDTAEAGAGPALPGGRHLGAAAGRILLHGGGVGGKFKLECEREEGGRRPRDGRGDRAPAAAPPLRRRQRQRQPAAAAANGWNARLKASVLMLRLLSYTDLAHVTFAMHPSGRSPVLIRKC